jgi:ABC-type glutathione transport system ATPase component
MTKAETALLHTQGLRKEYGKAESLVRAVDDVDLEVTGGETLAIWGRAGAGSRPCSTCSAALTARRVVSSGSTANASTG